jgi:hypothetical protein
MLMSPAGQQQDLAAVLRSPQQQAADPAAAAAAVAAPGRGVFPGMGLASLPAASFAAEAEVLPGKAAAAADGLRTDAGNGAAAAAAAAVDDDDDVALVSGEGVPGLGGVAQQGRLGSVRLLPSLV